MGLDFTFYEAIIYSSLVGLVIVFAGILLLRSNKPGKDENMSIESFFGMLVIFTACSIAFAHGSNDVANAVGPLAAVINTVSYNSSVDSQTAVTTGVLLLGSVGIVIGLITFGYRVIGTVGKGITKITPSSAFAANLATAFVVILSSGYGFPVSTTHTLIGAVIGVGLVNSSKSLSWGKVGQIFSGWIITIPIGAILSILIFLVFKAIYSF